MWRMGLGWEMTGQWTEHQLGGNVLETIKSYPEFDWTQSDAESRSRPATLPTKVISFEKERMVSAQFLPMHVSL